MTIELFKDYSEEILNNILDEATIFNSYTNFIMTNKQKRKDIKEYRMNWIINNFILNNLDKKINKNELTEYYKNNIKDEYSGLYNPPKCPFLLQEREERILKEKELKDYNNDDVNFHYDILKIKFSQQLKPKIDEEYDEYTEYLSETESYTENDIYKEDYDDIDYEFNDNYSSDDEDEYIYEEYY